MILTDRDLGRPFRVRACHYDYIYPYFYTDNTISGRSADTNTGIGQMFNPDTGALENKCFVSGLPTTYYGAGSVNIIDREYTCLLIKPDQVLPEHPLDTSPLPILRVLGDLPGTGRQTPGDELIFLGTAIYYNTSFYLKWGSDPTQPNTLPLWGNPVSLFLSGTGNASTPIPSPGFRRRLFNSVLNHNADNAYYGTNINGQLAAKKVFAGQPIRVQIQVVLSDPSNSSYFTSQVINYEIVVDTMVGLYWNSVSVASSYIFKPSYIPADATISIPANTYRTNPTAPLIYPQYGYNTNDPNQLCGLSAARNTYSYGTLSKAVNPMSAGSYTWDTVASGVAIRITFTLDATGRLTAFAAVPVVISGTQVLGAYQVAYFIQNAIA